jgi:hypothetical protein
MAREQYGCAAQARLDIDQRPKIRLTIDRPKLSPEDEKQLMEGQRNAAKVREWNEFLPDIDADHGDHSIGCPRHGEHLVFGAPCQLRLLAGQEHGRTIPLPEVGPGMVRL